MLKSCDIMKHKETYVVVPAGFVRDLQTDEILKTLSVCHEHHLHKTKIHTQIYNLFSNATDEQ